MEKVPMTIVGYEDLQQEIKKSFSQRQTFKPSLRRQATQGRLTCYHIRVNVKDGVSNEATMARCLMVGVVY